MKLEANGELGSLLGRTMCNAQQRECPQTRSHSTKFYVLVSPIYSIMFAALMVIEPHWWG